MGELFRKVNSIKVALKQPERYAIVPFHRGGTFFMQIKKLVVARDTARKAFRLSTELTNKFEDYLLIHQHENPDLRSFHIKKAGSPKLPAFNFKNLFFFY